MQFIEAKASGTLKRNDILIIAPDQYTSERVFSPLPLRIDFSFLPFGIATPAFTIDIAGGFRWFIQYTTNRNNPASVEYQGRALPVPTLTVIGFNEIVIQFPNTGDGISGDKYVIILNYTSNNIVVNINITVFRNISFNVRAEGAMFEPVENLISGNRTLTIPDPETACVSVPILNILGQTLVDGSDVGDVIFTIKDQYQYYTFPSEELWNCGIFHIKPSQVETTKFEKCCPKIVDVVRGDGLTLYDKLENLYINDEVDTFLQDFYPRLFFYAMLKYLLSRILYGEFNIDFLLQKYNKKFLNDLKHSRFCESLHLFLDCDSIIYGYDKYFKLE